VRVGRSHGEIEETTVSDPPVGAVAAYAAVSVGPLLGSLDRLDPRVRAGVVRRLQRANGNSAVARALGRRTPSPPKRRLARFEAPVHEATERHELTLDAAGALAVGALTNEEANGGLHGQLDAGPQSGFVPVVPQILPADVVFSMRARASLGSHV
jgi:hypothetical protein